MMGLIGYKRRCIIAYIWSSFFHRIKVTTFICMMKVRLWGRPYTQVVWAKNTQIGCGAVASKVQIIHLTHYAIIAEDNNGAGLLPFKFHGDLSSCNYLWTS